MTRSDVNSQRIGSYECFRFQLRFDGSIVAGFGKIGGQARATELVDYRDDGGPSASRKWPGHTRFEQITLERGVSHDTEFANWANSVFLSEATMKSSRKDIIIELHDELGQLCSAYQVFRCWVSSLTILPGLDASSDAVAIESMTIQHEGVALLDQ